MTHLGFPENFGRIAGEQRANRVASWTSQLPGFESAQFMVPDWSRARQVNARPSDIIEHAFVNLAPQLDFLSRLGGGGSIGQQRVAEVLDGTQSRLGALTYAAGRVMAHDSTLIRPESLRNRAESMRTSPNGATVDDVADYVIARIGHDLSGQTVSSYRDEIGDIIRARTKAMVRERIGYELIGPDLARLRLTGDGFRVTDELYDQRAHARFGSSFDFVVEAETTRELLAASGPGDQNDFMDRLTEPYIVPTEHERAFAGLYVTRAILMLSEYLTRAGNPQGQYDVNSEKEGLRAVLYRAASLITVARYPIDTTLGVQHGYNRTTQLFPQVQGDILTNTVDTFVASGLPTGINRPDVENTLSGIHTSDIHLAYLAANAGFLLRFARGEFGRRGLLGGNPGKAENA